MTTLKIALAAAALTVGMAASASAMPASKLGDLDIGVQADQVRTVCNRYGRCWWVPGSRVYGGYGYRGGRGYGYRNRGWHGGRRW